MKKLLLGTSALIGATALVASASAAAPELTISGNLDFRLVGGENQANASTDNLDAMGNPTDVGLGNNGWDFNRANSRSEIRFRAAGESDGGLAYGANIDYRYASNDTDEAYIYIGGDWGRVHLGDDDGAIDARTRNAGSIAPGAYLIDDTSTFIDMESNSDSDGTKVSYFSPDYNGFQFAASVYEGVGNFSDVAEIAGSYAGEYGAVGYTISAGYQTGSTSDAYNDNKAITSTLGALGSSPMGMATSTAEIDDLAEFVVGVQLDYDAWSFVVSYNDAGDSGALQRVNGTALTPTADADNNGREGPNLSGREFYSFGVAYDIGGGMAVGFSYAEASQDVLRLASTAAQAGTYSAETTETLYTIDFGFPIMEGMSGYAGLAFSEWERSGNPALTGTTAAPVTGIGSATGDVAAATDPAVSREATTYVIGTTVSF